MVTYRAQFLTFSRQRARSPCCGFGFCRYIANRNGSNSATSPGPWCADFMLMMTSWPFGITVFRTRCTNAKRIGTFSLSGLRSEDQQTSGQKPNNRGSQSLLLTGLMSTPCLSSKNLSRLYHITECSLSWVYDHASLSPEQVGLQKHHDARLIGQQDAHGD